MRRLKTILQRKQGIFAFLLIASLFTILILKGWTFKLGPEAVMVYHNHPYEAHIIFWSSGYQVDHEGKWVNQWSAPRYFRISPHNATHHSPSSLSASRSILP
jgi:hypothetical protein